MGLNVDGKSVTGPNRQQRRHGLIAPPAKRKYARDRQTGAANLVGGDQWVCPSCGDSPPNLEADRIIPMVHPACLPVIVENPDGTPGVTNHCLKCIARIQRALYPMLVRASAEGRYTPPFAIGLYLPEVVADEVAGNGQE